MLKVFHWIVWDWAVVWAKQGICIVSGIINNSEACCPLGEEMNSTWPFKHFLPVGKTWWSHWKQIPDCIIGLHHHDSRTLNSWGQGLRDDGHYFSYLNKGTNFMLADSGMLWTNLAPVCLWTESVISSGPIQPQHWGLYDLVRVVMAVTSRGWPGVKEKALLVTDILPFCTTFLWIWWYL